jgi:hypothetical protein
MLVTIVYCHVSGVCMTNKTGFGFDDRIYWTCLQQFTNHYLLHCYLLRLDTRLLTTLHYSIVVLRCTPSVLIYQRQSYFTTGDLPPISSSWCQALETHDQSFFFQLKPCGNSPYVTSSLTRRWVCLVRISLAFRQACVSHFQHIIENSSFCAIYKFYTVAQNARLLVCYLAMDVLLLSTYASGMCLPSLCLAVGLCVTILIQW